MDPVGYIDRSLSLHDQELHSFILQGLCYGRVEQILNSYRQLLLCLHQLGLKKNGGGLYKWLLANDPRELKQHLKKWKHRLNKPSDLISVLKILKDKVYTNHGSIKEYFFSLDNPDEPTFEETCIEFCKAFESKKTRTKKWSGTSASWFAPSPTNNGTTKRLMMWLRWMVREDFIDLGLWQKIAPQIHADKSRLLIPVDTHIFRFANEWKLVDHKSPSWKSVIQITETLRKIDNVDPVKFDFSICHEGKLRARYK